MLAGFFHFVRKSTQVGTKIDHKLHQGSDNFLIRRFLIANSRQGAPVQRNYSNSNKHKENRGERDPSFFHDA